MTLVSTNKNNLEKEDILNFWFEECRPEQWFKRNSEFDAMLESRFATTVEDVFTRCVGKLGRYRSKMPCAYFDA